MVDNQELGRERGDVPAAAPGAVTRTLLRWFMRSARVGAIERLSPRFRRIRLEGEALQGMLWAPGQKIQVAMGTGLAARTYTPVSWEGIRGTTQLLVFAHGDGPGSRWAEGLRVGDHCQFMGPRRSLDFPDREGPWALFGDETSFALGLACRIALGSGFRCVFEVSDQAEARSVLDAVGLGDATLIGRLAGDGHLTAAADALTRAARDGAAITLTGRAPAIQQLTRALKDQGVAASRRQAKAYWAPGKAGLD
ncbi:siderophore-interacting protein [Nitrospirillum iridis]|uniref:NADPH-dependent ferric siderophore reductase n=1 Tax=Nitrospirillum iridis TaxID=765888 RepID=A0A7X0AUB0_9PROT|nr:siderophore-interacting protein [Nitrospirillum iridis]MBB6250223.1 NADPH-dependent ferric siderophore reductase [Nitrospirillum iridis]